MAIYTNEDLNYIAPDQLTCYNNPKKCSRTGKNCEALADNSDFCCVCHLEYNWITSDELCPECYKIADRAKLF